MQATHLHTPAGPALSRSNPTRREQAARRGVAPPIASINITNLRLRTFIGFNPEERTKQQDVVINIVIDYRLESGALRDDIESALDYKTITKAILRHVEDNRFLLLEKLTGDILALCCEHPAVTFARVTVDKPHALRFADSVSVTLEFNDDDNTTLPGERR